MRKLLLILLFLALAGCKERHVQYDALGRSFVLDEVTLEEDIATLDRCMQAELFQSCMKVLPAGPLATKYNDWDEVIEECRDTARILAIRKRKHIKEQCRSE